MDLVHDEQFDVEGTKRKTKLQKIKRQHLCNQQTFRISKKVDLNVNVDIIITRASDVCIFTHSYLENVNKNEIDFTYIIFCNCNTYVLASYQYGYLMIIL